MAHKGSVWKTCLNLIIANVIPIGVAGDQHIRMIYEKSWPGFTDRA